MRVDRFLKARSPSLTQALLQKLLRKGQIFITEGGAEGKKKIAANDRLQPGQIVCVPSSILTDIDTKGRDLNVSEADAKMIRKCVIYRDKNLIAISKPQGLPVQGGSKSQIRNVDRFLPALRESDSDDVPRLLHRLDKDTSGVLLLARTRTAAAKYSRLFQRKEKGVEKCYLAFVAGAPDPPIGRIRGLLKKVYDPKSGKEKVVSLETKDQGSKVGVTEYEVMDQAGEELSMVTLFPITGRTHQLRVHCKEILNCPIIGDKKYTEKDVADKLRHLVGNQKLHLHSYAIRIPHPTKPGEKLTITAPLPPHMVETAKSFGMTSRPKINWVEPERVIQELDKKAEYLARQDRRLDRFNKGRNAANRKQKELAAEKAKKRAKKQAERDLRTGWKPKPRRTPK